MTPSRTRWRAPLYLACLGLVASCEVPLDHKPKQPPVPPGYGATGWGTATEHVGKAGFDAKCAACHTIGGGDRLGPDLAGLHERRDAVWLVAWMKDPPAMMKNDPIGRELFETWKRFPMMPNPMLTDGEIATLLDYVRWANEQGGEQPTALPTLVVARAASPLGTDPDDPAWGAAPTAEVPLQAQSVTAPMNPKATVAHVRVQALTDGEQVAFRLAWRDATLDANVNSSRFGDAVAVQLPLAADASPMMGGADAPVLILHWKALWQKDLDEGFQDVQHLHPNFWSDLYWFASGEMPYPVPEAFQDERSHAWFPAKQAQNPMARHDRIHPVEELVAEGFGTLTARPDSETVAQGRWQAGTWTVVIKRALGAQGGLDDEARRVAFAVWDGAEGQVGGRKQWSDWIVWEVTP